ncbi:catalase [Paenibacillus lentus]|uniref:catalase n=1 Tax=Paenibacillus lentus TaxID=1338368 RepID=UPI00364C1892
MYNSIAMSKKITHFDQELIPEQVVHARGVGAHGTPTAYGKAGTATLNKLRIALL